MGRAVPAGALPVCDFVCCRDAPWRRAFLEEVVFELSNDGTKS